MADDTKETVIVAEVDERQEAMRLVWRAMKAINAAIDKEVLAVKKAITEGMTRSEARTYVQGRIKRHTSKVDKRLDKLPSGLANQMLDYCTNIRNKFFTNDVFHSLEYYLVACKHVRRELKRTLEGFYEILFASEEPHEGDGEGDLGVQNIHAQINNEREDDDIDELLNSLSDQQLID